MLQRSIQFNRNAPARAAVLVLVVAGCGLSGCGTTRVEFTSTPDRYTNAGEARETLEHLLAMQAHNRNHNRAGSGSGKSIWFPQLIDVEAGEDAVAWTQLSQGVGSPEQLARSGEHDPRPGKGLDRITLRYADLRPDKTQLHERPYYWENARRVLHISGTCTEDGKDKTGTLRLYFRHQEDAARVADALHTLHEQAAPAAE